ncbi:MAG TPA: HAD-IA family hydrolase [Patescibacteria group bacterium]|nr:HAD-IA family hydrolase [Patescibacteria group bacterium]
MDKVDEKSLGRRLQEARQAAGLTQQGLCHRAGLSYSTLAKIERGAIKSPSIFTIGQIAGALGTSLDSLVGNSPTTADGPRLSKSGISFAFFDINGCLVRFFHRAFTKLAEETGAPADVIETTFWHYNDAVCKGEMTVAAFNHVLAKRLGVPKLYWQQYYLEAIDPITEMQELVRWASKNYRVGLLSNIMPGFIDVMRSKGLIPEANYAAIVDSSKVGCIKPDRQIYEVAQQMANCPSDQILLVDDSRTNVMAAEKMGWHVLWFDDYRPSESAKRIRAVLEPSD